MRMFWNLFLVFSLQQQRPNSRHVFLWMWSVSHNGHRTATCGATGAPVTQTMWAVSVMTRGAGRHQHCHGSEEETVAWNLCPRFPIPQCWDWELNLGLSNSKAPISFLSYHTRFLSLWFSHSSAVSWMGRNKWLTALNLLLNPPSHTTPAPGKGWMTLCLQSTAIKVCTLKKNKVCHSYSPEFHVQSGDSVPGAWT